MTPVRRISLKIERRELSLSITQTVTRTGEADAERVSAQASQPTACPECGSPWLPDFQNAFSGARFGTDIGLNLLQSAILERRLHLSALPGGELLICQRSFYQICQQIGQVT